MAPTKATKTAPKKPILKKTDTKKSILKKKDTKKSILKKSNPKKSILKKSNPKKTAVKKTNTKETNVKKLKKMKQEENIALEAENQANFDEVLLTLSDEDCKPGTLYIGHIPHGFYENAVKEYFSQFGTILKVRLARSKKTGGHKGYGFIQFASDEVAEIAAESMDGYLMFDKLLQCKVMSAHQQHRNLWKGANKRFVHADRADRDIKLQQRQRTEQQKRKVIRKVMEKDAKRQRKLKELGIDYEFPTAKSALKKLKEGQVQGTDTETSVTENVKKEDNVESVKTEEYIAI